MAQQDIEVGCRCAIMKACFEGDREALVKAVQNVPAVVYIDWCSFLKFSIVMEKRSMCIDVIVQNMSANNCDMIVDQHLITELFKIQRKKGPNYMFYAMKLITHLSVELNCLPCYEAFIKQSCELGDFFILHFIAPMMTRDLHNKYMEYCWRNHHSDAFIALSD